MGRGTSSKNGCCCTILGVKLQLSIIILFVLVVTPTPSKFLSEAFTTPSTAFTIPYTFGSNSLIHHSREAVISLHSAVQDIAETRNKKSTSSRNHKKNKPNKRHHDNKRVKTYKDIKAKKRKDMTTVPLSFQTNQEKKHDEKFPSQIMDSNFLSKNTTSSSFIKDTNTKTIPTGKSDIPNQQDASFVFTEPTHANKSHNNIQARIHNIHNIKLTRTMEEKKRSHQRMEKAQRLLRDLSPGNNKTMEVELDTSSNQKELASKTVPDTFWYNGNLEEGKGDYVTRWAKGVKVAEPLVKYDPVAAEKLLFRQPGKWIVRNIQIGFPLALWAGGVIVDIIRKEEEQNRRNRAKQLLKVISGLGPAIIKGGQALSSRSDLLPNEYLEELQKLQDDVPRFENDVAFQRVEEELGDAFDNIFELVESEPVAAASIGQVYKARLRSNGDVVAIKIQRPRCEEVIALDIYVLRWWSGVANIITDLLNRDINVQNIIDDFGELIYRELDYVAEAANAQRFSELYSNQVKDVFVPKVYSEFTTSKVLTMEWVDGFRLTDTASLDKYGLDRKKLVDTLVQCSLRQILGNGFFHADPHGGNLLVVPDGRLCYLDFGMMSYAAAEQRNGFLLAVIHIVNRDWDALVKMYQRLGFIPEGTDLKPISIALENTLPDALSADVSELNFKNIVGKLGDIMYKYPFSLPPFYISIIRCLGVLEGLAIQVDPQARIISEAYPYVASRVLTDPQEELQEALRRLALTSDGRIRWNRLERLLSKANGTSDYDPTVAVTQLTSYLISDNGEPILQDLVNQIVDGADALGAESVKYLMDASQAILIKDEVAAAKAFTTLSEVLAAGTEGGAAKLRDSLSEVLPEPTPAMQQFWRILMLLGTRGTTSDPSKLIPIVRRLSQEPKIQRVSSEIVARLGEKALSRSLRALFGIKEEQR
jgi:aarF domain-containing kinase